MILGFTGTVGSGKTLSAVWEAYQYYRNGHTVYSNIGLSFPYTKLTKRTFDELIKEKTQLRDAILLIDEIHIWLDSRSSMTGKNKAITYFVLQTRKRSVRLLWTSQHPDQVDKRLRNTTDIMIFCTNLTNKTSIVNKDDDRVYILQERLIMWDHQAPVRKRTLYANPIFPLYDTEEIVDMEDL